MQAEVECINCNFSYKGNFCPNCGQKLIDKRLTVRDSVNWLFSSVFNLEKGFIYTTKELFLRPGEVVRDVINGITVRHAHPFRFAFVWATLSAIIAVYVHAYDEIGAITTSFGPQSEVQAEFGKWWGEFMKKYMSFILLISIPLYSVGSAIMYKKRKFHFAEHLVLNSYASGFSIVVGIPIFLLYLVLPDTSYLSYTAMVVTFLSFAYVYSRFFKQNYFIGLFKFLISYLITIFLIFIIIAILTIVYVLLIKFAGLPNIFESFVPPKPN